MPPDRQEHTLLSDRKATATVVVLLLVHVVLGLHTAFRCSVTNDEFWHIPTGIWNLTTGQFHYDNLNPPLVRMLAAAPLVLAGAKTGDVAESADKETRADSFVAANRHQYSLLVSLSRIVPILISAATGWMIGAWAMELWGRIPAIAATAMWALSPNVIAHASLVTTDAAAAGALLLMMKAAWDFAGQPSWRRAALFGLWAGLAQLVKFTCLLGVPLVFAVWIIRRLRNSSVERRPFAGVAAKWVMAVLIGLLVLNVGYLFRGTGRTLNEYQFTSRTIQNLASALTFCRDVPILLPKDYIEGIDHQRHIMEGDHPTFLDGEMRYKGGFRDYYFRAWLYKTPHAIQAVVLLALILLLRPWRCERRTRQQILLIMPVVVLLWAASMSSMQLGLRYLLPVYPFLFLFASQALRVRGLAWVLLLVLVAGLGWSLRFHPDHLTYFNERSGGPQNGYTHLLDSNIDWGQGLLALREYMENHQIESVHLAYFGAVNPADLGISFTVPIQSQPPTLLWPSIEPGVYVVSVNFLFGRPGMVRDPDGTTRASGPYQFGHLRFFKPQTTIANCLFVFNLTPADIARMPSDRKDINSSEQ